MFFHFHINVALLSADHFIFRLEPLIRNLGAHHKPKLKNQKVLEQKKTLQSNEEVDERL